MIVELKQEFERVSSVIGATFVSKSFSELEDFVQNYDFIIPLINLKPIEKYSQNILAGGAIRYDFDLNLKFITNFKKSDHLEDTKDILIDQMIQVSENFVSRLNKNEERIFISTGWPAKVDVLRQFTSNLTCGVSINISLDTSCNKVPPVNLNNQLDYNIDFAMN